MKRPQVILGDRFQKPTNLTYLNAYQGALLKIIPKSASEASENYNKLVNLRMSLTRASSKDAQVWIQAMETIRERAELYNNDATWRDFSNSAVLMENALDPNDPQQAQVKFGKFLACMNDTQH